MEAIPFQHLGWLFILALLILWHAKELKGVLGLFVGYVLLRTAAAFIHAPSLEGSLLDKGAAFFLLSYVVLFVVSKWGMIPLAIPVLTLSNAVLTLLNIAAGHSAMGFLGNPSANSLLMVLSLPFCIEASLRKEGIALILLAVFLVAYRGSGTTIPLATLLVISVAYLAHKGPLYVIPLLALFAPLALFIPELFNAGERFARWELFLNDYPVGVWGTGGGTFQVIGVLMQRGMGEIFHDPHSDWLRLYLEFGPIGLLLGAFLFFRLLVVSYSKPAFFSGLSGIGFSAILTGVMHHALLALLTFWIVREVLKSRHAIPRPPSPSDNPRDGSSAPLARHE